MIKNKNIDSLEGLIKSLSNMKNEEWNFSQWLRFIRQADSCIELLNELREMNKPKPAEPVIAEEPKPKKGKK